MRWAVEKLKLIASISQTHVDGTFGENSILVKRILITAFIMFEFDVVCIKVSQYFDNSYLATTNKSS